jgi:hypothetical protein
LAAWEESVMSMAMLLLVVVGIVLFIAVVVLIGLVVAKLMDNRRSRGE